MQLKDEIHFQFHALMEVEDHLAAQAPSNVGKGKEIATRIQIVLATLNVVLTIALLPLNFHLTTTAAMTLLKVSN